MASDGEPPLVGELDARVRSTPAQASFVSASAGATVIGRRVELHRGDVRPTGDLVVETTPSVVHAGRARAYVALGDQGRRSVRARAHRSARGADPGIALALVVDTSLSAGVSSLETERAVVDAVLEGLGPNDSLVVLAADQTVRARRATVASARHARAPDAVRKGLAGLHAGGASNLAVALEQAADVLDAPGPAHAGAGMVVYLGDGRASIGEATARDIRRRLGRRDGGVPRMGAVAVGHGADRWLLAQLVAGSGPVYEAHDRADAARVGAAIVADALEPTLRDVDLDLGPSIDRVYPREARAALAGSTVTVTGRLRGNMPDHVDVSVPARGRARRRGAAARRRWAARRGGRRAALGAAHGSRRWPPVATGSSLRSRSRRRSRLLTPWTGWFFSDDASSSPFEQRLLDLSPTFDAAFAARVEPAPRPSSLLLEPPHDFTGDASLGEASVIAAERAIEEAVAHLQACRDARAAVRPDVTGSLRVDMSVDPNGHASDVRVSATSARDDDPVLDRCAKGVVAAVTFFASGVRIHVTHDITLPPARTPRRTQCSVASQLPLPVRRGIWRSRLAGSHGPERAPATSRPRSRASCLPGTIGAPTSR